MIQLVPILVGIGKTRLSLLTDTLRSDGSHTEQCGQSLSASVSSAIVAMAAAIVPIANVVMASVFEPQQSWS